MKFNAKYDAKVERQNATNAIEESDTEPESDVKKIASELEEKIRPAAVANRRMSREEKRQQRRMSVAAAAEAGATSPSVSKSRLSKKAEEKQLKLHIPKR